MGNPVLQAPQESEFFGRLINDRAVQRLRGILDRTDPKVVRFGGIIDETDRSEACVYPEYSSDQHGVLAQIVHFGAVALPACALPCCYVQFTPSPCIIYC